MQSATDIEKTVSVLDYVRWVSDAIADIKWKTVFKN